MKKTTERQLARPVATSGVKVQRYFPGKAPDALEHDLSASESEGDDEDKPMPVSIGAASSALKGAYTASSRHRTGDDGLMASESDEGSDSEVERVLQARLRARRRATEASSDSSGDEEDVNERQMTAAWHAALDRQMVREPALSAGDKASMASGLPSETTGSSSEGTYSDSGDSESEHEAPPMLKPIFVSRSQRQVQAGAAKESDNGDSSILTPEDVAAEDERLARREESVRMAAAEAARAREAPEINTSSILDLDDTDDVDIAAEFEAWRQRELLRIKREKDARVAIDLEEAERERRNNMSEGEKYAEDMEKIRNQRREKAQ